MIRKLVQELDWMRIAERLGVPVAFGTALLVFGIYSVSWLAHDIFKPMIDRQIECMPKMESAMEEIAKAATDKQKLLTIMTESLKKQGELHQRDHDQLVKMTEVLTRIEAQGKNGMARSPSGGL